MSDYANNQEVHPDAPAGGGGPGRFHTRHSPHPVGTHLRDASHASHHYAHIAHGRGTPVAKTVPPPKPAEAKKAVLYTLVIGINPSATNKWGNVDTGTNPGHAVIALKDPQGKLEKVFSYGPKRHRQQLACSFPAETNYPLDKTDTYTIFEFSITEEQRKKALAKMKEIEDNPGTFDAKDQCTTKSLDVARAAGLSVPDGKGGVVVYFCPDPGQVPTPVNLDKDLLKQFPDAKKVPATYFSGFVQFK
jgi:hypothetical protein